MKAYVSDAVPKHKSVVPLQLRQFPLWLAVDRARVFSQASALASWRVFTTSGAVTQLNALRADSY